MSDTLLTCVPPIRRARGYRLYAMDNRRFLDLWQWGGRAVLGHTAPRLLTTLKNLASRGLFAPLPHPSLRRLERALEGFFPGRTVRIYADEASADRALAMAGYGPLEVHDFMDPAVSILHGTVPFPRGCLWRPWLDDQSFEGVEVLAPIIPLPWASAPIALAFRHGETGSVPPSDLIPPLIAAAAAQGIYDMAALLKKGSPPSFRRTMEALASCSWKLHGIYLSPLNPWTEDAYELFFKRALAGGILIPPRSDIPMILPREISPGEDAALARVLHFEP